MDLTKFYQDNSRFSYHPAKNISLERKGLKKFIAHDDRFSTVTNELIRITSSFSKLPVKVLDIGIGDAVYESLIPEKILKRLEIYGIDISSKQLSRAKRFLKEAKVIDLNRDSIPYNSNSFNVVLISELLEHIFYPEMVLKEATRVLKKGGYVILTYPNTGALQLRMSLLIVGMSPLLNYPENREHIRFFSKKDILLMLNNKLKLVKYQGLSSFFFDKWNFPTPVKLITPRFLQILGNIFLPNLALGNLMILRK